MLSDPFQRQRYDASVEQGSAAGANGVEIVDDESEPAVQLTGWRKLMAPSPPKPKAVNGSNGAKTTPPRPGKQPTVTLPDGMQIAQPRARGMSLLFDLSIVLVLFYAVNVLLPPVFQSDPCATIRDQVTVVNDAKSAQGKIDDAQSSISDADKAITKAQNASKQQDLEAAQSDKKSAQSDLKSAQQDFAKAQKDFNDKQADRNLEPQSLPHDSDKLQSIADDLAGQIRGTTFIAAGITLAVAAGLPRADHRAHRPHVRHAATPRPGRAHRRVPGGLVAVVRALPGAVAVRHPRVRHGARDPRPGGRARPRAVGVPPTNGQGLHDKLRAHSWSRRNLDLRRLV